MRKDLIERAIKGSMLSFRLHRQKLDELVSRIGFHRTAHRMLMYLAEHDVCSAQRILAERFSITPAAVTGILKSLENDGYISRSSGRDSRYNIISITQKGREIIEVSKESFFEINSRMFEGFSEDELLTVIDFMTRMNKNLGYDPEAEQ